MIRVTLYVLTEVTLQVIEKAHKDSMKVHRALSQLNKNLWEGMTKSEKEKTEEIFR